MLTRDRSFYQKFIILTIGLMLEQVVILSVNLADNIMLGSYSESALAGVAAVNQIQFILQQLVHAIGNGVVILGSQYWGQKRTLEIRKLTGIAALFNGFIALSLFVAMSLFPHAAVSIFSPNSEIIEQGMAYLSIIRFSYLFFSLTAVFMSAMRTVEIVRIAVNLSIVSLIVNCAINYVLIFGHFGAPQMGVRGAAIGTLVARIVEFILLSAFVFLREKRLRLVPKDLIHFDRKLLRDFVSVTTPILIAAIVWGTNNATHTVILGHISDEAIAAQSISSNLYLLLKVAAVGAASAASIIIGKTIGENVGMPKIREYTRTLQILFVLVGLLMGSIMFIIRIPLLNLYNIKEETLWLANAFMIVQSVIMVTMSYQMSVSAGIIRGGGDSRFYMILDIISIWGIMIPLSLIGAFVLKLSPLWVFILLNSDQVFKCVPAFIYVNRYKWVRHLTRP